MSCEAGKPRPPGRAAIALAVPAGSRRPPRRPGFQPAYLAALAQDPRLAARRGDFRHAVFELARIYARHASWRDMTTWRPRERICVEIGSPRDRSRPLSVTAYRAARSWLQDHGYLGLITPGWTSALRAAVLDDGDQLCPLYVLAIPRTPKTRHIPPARLPVPPVNRALTTSRSEGVKVPAHARENTWGKPSQDQDQEGPRSARTVSSPKSKTQTRSEARIAAAVILERLRALRPLTAEHVASVIRLWTAAGWTPGDVVWAVGHQPPGPTGRCRPYGYTADVRHPAAWLGWRLAQWTGPDGTPLPAPLSAPSRRHAAERERDRAKQAARRAQAQQAAQARAAADVDARGAAGARQGLAGRGLPIQATRPTSRKNGRFSPPAKRPDAAAPPPQKIPDGAAAARAWIHQDLLTRLDGDAGALIRATRHRARSVREPGHAAAVRDEAAPLIARAETAASRQREREDP